MSVLYIACFCFEPKCSFWMNDTCWTGPCWMLVESLAKYMIFLLVWKHVDAPEFDLVSTWNMCKSCLDVICSSVEIKKKKHCSFSFCSFAYALKLYIPVYHTEIGIGNTDARLQLLSCPSPSRSDPWKIVGIFLTVWNALEKKNPLSPLRSFGFSFVYGDSACEELKKEGSMPHQELLVSVASGNPMAFPFVPPPSRSAALLVGSTPGARHGWLMCFVLYRVHGLPFGFYDWWIGENDEQHERIKMITRTREIDERIV